ncbi:MAG: DNA-directed RNA polymerase subunit omega [Firmicutes bacterium]|nr:DNA-directed RNA polymerase subunit omega [Bacillota bacterium]
MLYPKIEDCVEKVGCKYALAIIVAKRAKEISVKQHASFLNSKTKELTYALREVANGNLVPVFGMPTDN